MTNLQQIVTATLAVLITSGLLYGMLDVQDGKVISNEGDGKNLQVNTNLKCLDRKTV